MEISNSLQWFVPQSHNGLLEIMLFLGVVGAAYFAFLLLRTIVISLRCMRTQEQPLAVSALLFSIGIITIGISEAVLVNGFQALTGAFMITMLLCERALSTDRLLRRSRLRVLRQQRAMEALAQIA